MNITPDINAEEGVEPSTEASAGAKPTRLQDVWNGRRFVYCRSILNKIVNRLDRIFGDLIAISLGLGIVGLFIANSVLERQSTDLTVLRPNLKIWFAEAFNGRDAEFGRLELAWRPADGALVATIEDAEIRGSDGELLERFELIRSTFRPKSDLRARPDLINVQIKGGVLTYLEDADGQIIAGLGPPQTVGRVGPVYRSGEMRQSASPLREMLQDLEFVQIEEAEIYVRNAISGIDLKSDVEILQASFSENGDLILAAIGTVDQTTTPMPFTVNTISDADFDSVKLRLNVSGARPDEIAPTKGRFWEFQGLAAPVDLTVDVDFSRSEGLRSASVDMEVSKGEFTLLREESPRKFPLQSLVARASLAPGNERMDIETLDLKAPNLSFNGSGFLTQLGNLSDGDENSSPVFNLSVQNILANMTPHLPVETKIKSLKVIGQADVDSRTLNISSGRLEVFDTAHEFDCDIALQSNNSIKSAKLNTTMTGVLKPDQFLSLWPVKMFEGARGWIEGAVLDGDITEFEGEIDFDEAFFETRDLTDDRLNLRWGGTNTTVRYMQTLPPATGASGKGQILGNRLTMSLDEGQVDALTLTGGTIEIPKLRPKNGDIIITMDGQGALSEFVRLADFPPFEIAKRYNMDATDLDGEGNASVKIRRSLRAFLPRDEIDYQINGDFTGASAPFELGGYEITNATVSLDANKERVIMTGPVDIGPWRADMRWNETLGANAPLTQYGVSGLVDAGVLDELGLASRTWFDGSAFVTIDAQGRGMDIAEAKLDVDLTKSDLSIERIWMKTAGDPANLTGQLTRGADGSYNVDNAQLTSLGVDVGGRISLEPDYKLRQIDLSNMSISSLIDGAVKITPDRAAGRIDMVLDAGFLDVSPWTEDLFAERQSNLDVPLTLQGRVASLILDEYYPVTESNIYFSHTGEVIETARLEALSDGKPLKLELSTRADRKRQLAINVPDASKAVSAFMGLDNTAGGRLEVTVDLPAAGEEGAYVGEADMRDFKLNEAPALAQLLSLASLTGLADTLTGGSMQFEKFKVPFTMLGDDIAIRDARLYGPALGMTGDGDIDLDLRVLDFDGTLVPAYTANSILGDIPVLGDLFVQEKDGGLFALTYTVSGTFEQTQIAINPLSALTPGFLRGIFKRDRSEADDAMKEAIEDVQPKPVEGPEAEETP
ncbi:MAG: AsmA-like C-terminal domain-containing protein [Litorimonas sp.]